MSRGSYANWFDIVEIGEIARFFGNDIDGPMIIAGRAQAGDQSSAGPTTISRLQGNQGDRKILQIGGIREPTFAPDGVLHGRR